jgi:similar to stage IV sporulation protein
MRNMWKEWMDGHITITVRGKRFERLLNLAVRDGIRIWNIRRVGQEVSRCDMMIRDFFRLRPLLRETGCRVHVEHREGLPFWLVRVRRRLGFTVGAFLFLFGLYMLSSFIWNVEVHGTKQLSPQKVSQAAEKVGIKQGAWKAKLKEPETLQRQLMNLLPEASLVLVDIQGTKAIIQVVERDEPEKPKAIGPRNLVAKKRAVIHSILTEAGTSMVSVNQFVEKGQVLISGIIGNEQSQRAVPARGKVEGEVWYVSNISLPLSQVQYHLTGEQQQKQYLVVGPYAVQVWPFKEQPYAKYETEEKRYDLDYAGFSLPLGWKTVTLSEVEANTRRLTTEEAVELGKAFARQDVLRRAGKNAYIKDEKVLHAKAENGKVYVSIHFSVIEEIAVEQPLVAAPSVRAPNGN